LRRVLFEEGTQPKLPSDRVSSFIFWYCSPRVFSPLPLTSLSLFGDAAPLSMKTLCLSFGIFFPEGLSFFPLFGLFPSPPLFRNVFSQEDSPCRLILTDDNSTPHVVDLMEEVKSTFFSPSFTPSFFVEIFPHPPFLSQKGLIMICVHGMFWPGSAAFGLSCSLRDGARAQAPPSFFLLRDFHSPIPPGRINSSLALSERPHASAPGSPRPKTPVLDTPFPTSPLLPSWKFLELFLFLL